MTGDDDTANLMHALRSNDRNERAVAALALSDHGAVDARGEIESLLDDEDDLVATAATLACFRLGANDIPFDRALAALTSDDEDAVQTAVVALSEVGSAAVPAIAARLDTPDEHASRFLRILGDIGTDPARAIVERAAESEDQALAGAAREELDDWDDDEEE